MKRILNEIESGKFVEEFMAENKSGKRSFDALRAKGRSHPIEDTGEKLRAMMPWIAKNKLVNKAAN
jgi:ketol-acid reductoisomerase